jgi:hypothetical protein
MGLGSSSSEKTRDEKSGQADINTAAAGFWRQEDDHCSMTLSPVEGARLQQGTMSSCLAGRQACVDYRSSQSRLAFRS